MAERNAQPVSGRSHWDRTLLAGIAGVRASQRHAGV